MSSDEEDNSNPVSQDGTGVVLENVAENVIGSQGGPPPPSPTVDQRLKYEDWLDLQKVMHDTTHCVDNHLISFSHRGTTHIIHILSCFVIVSNS